MNLDRLSSGEKLLGASGLALFVFSFVGLWAKLEVDAEGPGADLISGTDRFNAWDAYGFLVKLALILALVAAGLVVARAANANLAMPVANLYRGIAGATLVLLVIALLIGPDESGSGSVGTVSVEISRGIGLFIGTLLAAAMAAGAWMHSESPATPAGPPAPAA
ncbi:MAG: hypothetical protein M3271_01120 [Actinomycetota bacterium]|nr:hypothetical protein [Actinomycetota bacterium]